MRPGALQAPTETTLLLQHADEQDQKEAKQRRIIDILILGGLSIPPLFACTLYYPASTNLAKDIGIHDENSLRLIGVSCLMAELALYEVKTLKFGKQLSQFVNACFDLEGGAEWAAFLRSHIGSFIKHALLMAVSCESSYMYKYVSEDLVGSPFMAWMTFFAKYTTFHVSLDELVVFINKELRDQQQSSAVKVRNIGLTLLLGMLGATYVYGKAEESFEDLGASPESSAALGVVAMLPTAFLTGTSLVNLIRGFHYEAQTTTWQAVGLLLLRELFYIWLALTSAAPNGFFLESWGRQNDYPIVAVWIFTIVAGLLSGITKRDSLPKVVTFVDEKSQPARTWLGEQLPCFAHLGFFQAPEPDSDPSDEVLLHPPMANEGP